DKQTRADEAIDPSIFDKANDGPFAFYPLQRTTRSPLEAFSLSTASNASRARSFQPFPRISDSPAEGWALLRDSRAFSFNFSFTRVVLHNPHEARRAHQASLRLNADPDAPAIPALRSDERRVGKERAPGTA